MFSTSWVDPDSSFIESFVWRTYDEISGDNPDLEQEGELVIWMDTDSTENFDEYICREIEYSVFLELKRKSNLGESVGLAYNNKIKNNPKYPPAEKLR